jgi:hydroxyethylthiazole kinase-like uncharacterized protein yjeF
MSTAEVYQTAQIRQLETFAKERFGISGELMMQRAGEAALQYFLKRWHGAKRVTVVCGAGNNGGDGYVFAQKAHKRGLTVTVLQVGESAKLKDEAKKAYESCLAAGVAIRPFQFNDNLQQSDVIVDAIYGIGLQGSVRDENRFAIDAINKSLIPVLAIDVPSGVDANTGSVMGSAVFATATVTFIGEKLGLVTGAGMTYAGDVHCDDLQLPLALFALVTGDLERIEMDAFESYLKPRPRDFHKGNAGHVLIVGGEEGFSGAPCMSALAALRVGAGLVTVATHPKHAAFLNLTHPEIMCHGIHTSLTLKKLLQKATVVVIGPGMGKSLWAKMLLKTVLKTALPLIVDADALNLIAERPRKLSNWILTPHPGEASRLLKITTKEVQQDRYAALQKMQQMYEGVSILKGAGTLVAAANARSAVCTAGNPGMATGGMGDVLTGVIGGLLAQGAPLAVAAKMGVFVHARAGDLAAENGGERGLMATDLMPYLRQMVN